MAIEIRELVVKATVHKVIRPEEREFVTLNEMRRLQNRITDQIMDKVKSYLEELRSNR